MGPDYILYLILAIITIEFIFDQVIDYLNLKARRKSLPSEIKGFYSEEKYRKSQEYQKTVSKFSFITSTFGFVVSFALLAFGGFGYLNALLTPVIDNPIYLALVYFGVLYILSDLINLPFQVYSTFVIEERFGFNRTSIKTFVLDKVKGYLLTAVIGGLLVGLLLYFIITVGSGFWIYFWAVATLFILFVNLFYTSLILPLFNKLTPMEEGGLKSAIEAYSKKVSFPLDNIFVIDGSKRSKKANAFFSGLGKRKKIVLYDTLIENHSTEELVAVLAHEVGHFKKKHIIFGFLMSILQTGLTLFILSLMIFSPEVSQALGANDLYLHLNIIAFGILYSPISKVLGILSNIYSRKNEFEADAYAKETYNGDYLQTALKKLSVDNLSNLYPHRLYVFINYSHPPLLKRLEALRGG